MTDIKGYICGHQTYEVGQTYKKGTLVVYDSLLAIRCKFSPFIRHSTFKYEVTRDRYGDITVVREISPDEYMQQCTGVYTDSSGNRLWYHRGTLHRHDGPAVTQPDGAKQWYVDGRLHREDGPAEIYANGEKVWYLDDKRHREDGPAWTYADGYKVWYLDDKRHRADGLAYIL